MLDRSGPVWLEQRKMRYGGVDHLGVRLPGLQMAEALLPGITNTTRRARNYSLIAWMYTYANGGDDLRALESAFVHATRRHDHLDALPSSGVVGSQSVPEAKQGGQLPLFKDEPIVSVLRADFYGPSARLLGLAGKATSGRHAYESIAKRIAESLPIPSGDTLLSARQNITAAEADALSPLCLCQPPQVVERDLLVELFFRLNEPRTKTPGMDEYVDEPRRLSLALLLLALEPTDDPQKFLLQRFLDWGLGRGKWSPPAQLEQYAHGWAVQGMRWHFRHALEAVWSGFGRLLGKYSFPGTSLRPYIEAVAMASKGKGPWTPKPDKLIGAIAEDVPDDPGVELLGHLEIDKWLKSSPERAVLIAATQLAAMATRITLLDQKDRHFNHFLQLGEPDRVSLAGFSRRFDEKLTVREWIAHLFERYAIGQHFLTGARKWLTGIDGFFFHPTGEGYRLRKENYTWNPDPGQTKIWSSMRILWDLGLIGGVDDWRTTPEGLQIGKDCINAIP